MKKQLTFSFLAILFAFNSFSQDVGYRTVDAGVGYNYVKDGMELNLQVAFNSEERHSFLVHLGYKRMDQGKTSLHTSEVGNGWGGSVGYRYHFSVVPKRFFIWARAGFWNMNVAWSVPEMEGSTRVLFIQPAVETGYTVLINDYFYITPHIAASYLHALSSNGQKVNLSDGGFVPTAGITMGWRF
jgi:hypothetical protein